MYSGTDLKEEIKRVIDRTISAGMRVRASWIATEIGNSHPDHFGKDVDFWQLTGISGVHAEVRRFISSIKTDEEDEEQQGKLPFTVSGYRYLQKIYFVSDPTTPEEGNVGIPINEMSDSQIENKANEYEKMAAGCVAHADELRRYLRNRSRAA